MGFRPSTLFTSLEKETLNGGYNSMTSGTASDGERIPKASAGLHICDDHTVYGPGGPVPRHDPTASEERKQKARPNRTSLQRNRGCPILYSRA